MPAPDVELIQFRYSPYNEKVRWALDWKRIPHTRRSLLPGPHAPVVLRLTGRTEVPVLRLGGEVIAGSARILEAIEERFPDPPLFPADPDERARALEIQSWFDDDVGPCVRRALFHVMLPSPDYLVRVFAGHRGPGMQRVYRAMLPLVMPIMRRSMQVNAYQVERSAASIRDGLDFVVKHAGPDAALVGGAFGVADLAVASILAPLADPPHPDMARPDPKPEALVRFLREWARHPGVAWVHETYRRHRPGSAEATATA